MCILKNKSIFYICKNYTHNLIPSKKHINYLNEAAKIILSENWNKFINILLKDGNQHFEIIIDTPVGFNICHFSEEDFFFFKRNLKIFILKEFPTTTFIFITCELNKKGKLHFNCLLSIRNSIHYNFSLKNSLMSVFKEFHLNIKPLVSFFDVEN
jgi:hypothetical protein